MKVPLVAGRVNINDLIKLVSRKLEISQESVLPYAESTEFITELFKSCDHQGCRITGAGYLVPEIAIAADRAEIEIKEVLGDSPFSCEIKEILADVESPRQIIYAANPGRISGAHFSVEEMRQMAEAVPEGALVIDEYYFDHFGISALPLFENLDNLVVLRSFTSAFGITSSDAGYAVSTPAMIGRIKDRLSPEELTTTVRKTILASVNNDEALELHLKEINDEQLRVAVELNRLKVQCRMTASDFLLIRVADPSAFGNFLARCKIPIENLNGYPLMRNYVRYQLQSPLSNDKMIEAFKKMPVEHYLMKTKDLRPVTLRKPAGKRAGATRPGNRLKQRVEKKAGDRPQAGNPEQASKTKISPKKNKLSML